MTFMHGVQLFLFAYSLGGCMFGVVLYETMKSHRGAFARAIGHDGLALAFVVVVFYVFTWPIVLTTLVIRVALAMVRGEDER
jgi:uncharacterized membrane protein